MGERFRAGQAIHHPDVPFTTHRKAVVSFTPETASLPPHLVNLIASTPPSVSAMRSSPIHAFSPPPSVRFEERRTPTPSAHDSYTGKSKRARSASVDRGAPQHRGQSPLERATKREFVVERSPSPVLAGEYNVRDCRADRLVEAGLGRAGVAIAPTTPVTPASDLLAFSRTKSPSITLTTTGGASLAGATHRAIGSSPYQPRMEITPAELLAAADQQAQPTRLDRMRKELLETQQTVRDMQAARLVEIGRMKDETDDLIALLRAEHGEEVAALKKQIAEQRARAEYAEEMLGRLTSLPSSAQTLAEMLPDRTALATRMAAIEDSMGELSRWGDPTKGKLQISAFDETGTGHADSVSLLGSSLLSDADKELRAKLARELGRELQDVYRFMERLAPEDPTVDRARHMDHDTLVDELLEARRGASARLELMVEMARVLVKRPDPADTTQTIEALNKRHRHLQQRLDAEMQERKRAEDKAREMEEELTQTRRLLSATEDTMRSTLQRPLLPATPGGARRPEPVVFRPAPPPGAPSPTPSVRFLLNTPASRDPSVAGSAPTSAQTSPRPSPRVGGDDAGKQRAAAIITRAIRHFIDSKKAKRVTISRVQALYMDVQSRRGDKQLKRRAGVAMELLESERALVEDLATAKMLFIDPLNAAAVAKTGPVSLESVSKMFLNWTDVYNATKSFCADLERAIGSALSDNAMIGKILNNHVSNLRAVYGMFMCGAKAAQAELDQNLRTNKGFKTWARTACQDQRCRLGDIVAYLQAISQRFARYVFFFEELVKTTPPKHPDAGPTSSALAHMQVANQKIAREAKEAEERNSLALLGQQLTGFPDLVQPYRHLIRQGDMVRILADGKTEPVLVYLLTDLIVLATPKNAFLVAVSVFAGSLTTGDDGQHLTVRNDVDRTSVTLRIGSVREAADWARDIENVIKAANDESLKTSRLL